MIDPELFSRRQGELLAEFFKLITDRPEFEDSIPQGAYVIFQVAGDDEFNSYGRELANRRRAEGYEVVFIRVQGLAPPQGSRLISPKVVSFSDAA